ncbi:T9SS type A sorting domain-containing protein, partial [uncultured Muriicola sp.]|uniref:T9SS type A sorting domain-containing protein n=1 Tax=uncultured Muriicola sp. TaxID=1583102 RepID=UPI00260F3E63
YAGETAEVIRILREEFDLLPLANDPWDPDTSDFIVDPDTIISRGLGAIDVLFPIDRILPPEPPASPMSALIDYFDIIKSAQALYTPFTSGALEETGEAITQGDAAQSSDIVRESFRIVTPADVTPEGIVITPESSRSVDGTGVNIVLFSNSFDANPPEPGQPTNEAIDVGNGDLPGTAGNGNPNGYDTPVQIIKDYPFSFGIISDEGRAMGQLAHDMAPGAKITFRTGVLSPRDFEVGIQNLDSLGYTTIGVDDITFPGEPMFGISNIGKAIQKFTKNGNNYFTSAGNFYDNAYQAIFQSSVGANIPDFVTDPDAVAHVFGTPNGSEDIYQRFSVKNGETYMIVLQWAEDFASQNNILGANFDLDFWVVDDQERLLVGNNYYNDNDTEIEEDGRDPIEYITFRATADGEANFMITSANGDPGSLPFRYIIFVANNLEILEYFDGASTIMGHPMTPEAFAIGAVDFRKAASPEPQVFSSYAGTLSDGNSTEVILSSFDGVNTNVPTIGQDSVAGIPVDGDEFKNFFGTSASVVHVAAAFALMKSAIPSWYGTESVDSVDILQKFIATAIPAGNPDQTGAGVINAAEAFKLIATQTGVIKEFTTEFTSEEGSVISADEFELTLNGLYFPQDPKVLYGEEELEIVSTTDTEIIALVGPFTGNEPVTVLTNSTVPKGTDGGKSDPIYLLDNKVAINVIANDITIEYGEDYEDLFGFTVEGLPEDVEIGVDLPDIVFTTTAVPPYPSVRNGVKYNIFPAFDEENATDVQRDSLERYVVNYKTGLLAVTKKDLTITPDTIVTTYGETINIKLDYLYNILGITDTLSFTNSIRAAHTSTFDIENNLAIINGFKALVNDEKLTILDTLENSSWIATNRTIENGFKALVNQGNLLNLNPTHFDDYSDYLTNGFKALVNDFKALVNSEDLFNNVASIGSIQNGFKALVNDEESNAGGSDDTNDYSEVFAIAYDGDGDSPISQFYSLNLITGLEATGPSEFQYSFPGTLLSPIAYNFSITYGRGIITVEKAELTAIIGDLVIDEGTKLEEIDTSLISYDIDGYVYDESVEEVFPDGIPYVFEDANGVPYTEEAPPGVYFIKIKEPLNYTFDENTQKGVLYVNPTGNYLRKIRTYLDCVEEDFTEGTLDYIAHYRYENPNDETIYIAEGPENQLTGPAEYSGELPFIFLPGQGTFQIRFDGNTMKWELTSRDSTHKSSTTTSSNANSNRCDAVNSETESGIAPYILYPNPVNGMLYIDQNNMELVTLDVFDIYGILYLTQTLDGRNGPTTHEINMSACRNGMYFIRCTNGDDVQVYSVVKE